MSKRVEQSYFVKARRRFQDQSRQLIDQFDKKSRQFAKSVHDDRTAYVAFAAMDATNLCLSSKMVFEAKNATTNATSNDITNEWREWLHSPAGAAISSVELAFLLTFSMVGSYYEDDDKNQHKRNMVIAWGYIRDTYKPIKWLYKGVRNWLQIIMRFSALDLRYFIVPVGLTLGVLAVLNRYWLRWMKKERKAMMKENAELYQEILAKNCAFHQLMFLPSLSDKTYIHSYVYINQDIDACGIKYLTLDLITDLALQKALDELPETMPAAYVVCNQQEIYYLDKVTREIKKLPNEKIKELMAAVQPTEELKLLSKHKLGHIQSFTQHQHQSVRKGLFYIGQDGHSSPVELNDLNAFSEDVQQEIDENIVRVMSQKLKNVRDGRCRLVFATDLKSVLNNSAYYNNYIYLTDDASAKEKLIYINKTGVVKSVRESTQFQFEQEYKKVKKNNNLITLSADQINDIIQEHGGEVQQHVGLSLEAWDQYKKQSLAKIRSQTGTLPYRCYVAATSSAISDAIYFHGGAPVTLVYFVPNLFIAMVAVSSFYVLLWIVARINDEYDFQRKLNVTEIRVKLALNVKELDIILFELVALSKAIAEAEAENIDVTHFVAERSQLLTRFEVLLKEYDVHRNLLEKKLVHSYGSAMLAGLSNGLAVQGAIASFMYAIAAFSLLLIAPVSVEFVLGCTIAGVVAIGIFIAQSMLSHYVHINKLEERKPPKANLAGLLESIKLKKESLTEDDEIIQARASLWHDSIDPSPAFYIIEWCEIIRLIFSGAVKGEKGISDLSGEKNSFVFGLMMVSSLVASCFYGLRALAKGLGASPVDSAPSKTGSGKDKKRVESPTSKAGKPPQPGDSKGDDSSRFSPSGSPRTPTPLLDSKKNSSLFDRSVRRPLISRNHSSSKLPHSPDFFGSKPQDEAKKDTSMKVAP